VYKYKCVKHAKYGKCLIINAGGAVASRVPNPRNGGQMILKELFVHSGSINSVNPLWRGSTGCPTLHPDMWPKFIACFTIGETGELIVKPLIEDKPV
jgi:hypothetical protein